MDPADQWARAVQDSKSRLPTQQGSTTQSGAHAAYEVSNSNNKDDYDYDDDDDPFADFADDELLRNVPCAFDAVPEPVDTGDAESSGAPRTLAALHPLVASSMTKHKSDDLGDTLAETHQSGFFSASLMDDDWGEYGLADQGAIDALRVAPDSTITPVPRSAAAAAPSGKRASEPIGVFTSAVPAHRPSFLMCGDDGKQLWVTASGMESTWRAHKANHVSHDTTSEEAPVVVSSAYLDVDDEEAELEESTQACLSKRDVQDGKPSSLLGHVSMQDLLQEARTALAEDAAARRVAAEEALAAQERAEAERETMSDVLLAAAVEEDEDEESNAVRARASHEAIARRRLKRSRGGAGGGGADDSDDGEKVEMHGRMADTPHERQRAKKAGAAAEDMLWVAKYTPRNFREVLSDESINLELLRWLKSWEPYVFETGSGGSTTTAMGTGVDSSTAPQPPEERIAVLVGPPGVGKTTLAHVLAAHCGYEAIEINASVERTASRLEGLIQLAVSPSGKARRRARHGDTAAAAAAAGDTSAASHTIHTLADHLLRPKCLIIDEMDGITSNVAQFLLRQSILRPVFCLCNDFYVPSLRLMRQRCRHVFHLPPIQPQRLLARLEEVCGREHLRVEQAALAELVQSSHGDIRSCLNTLQFLKGLPAVSGESSSSTTKKASTAHPGAPATATMELVRAVQGKDNKLDVWESWNLVFVKSDRNRTVQLLKKDCGVDYEALVAASTVNRQSAMILRKERERGRLVGEVTATHTNAQAQTSSAPRTQGMVPLGFRVDPGYLFVSHELPRCADLPLLLDGLQENYCARPYTDYTLRRTLAAAEGFSSQDVITTAAFSRAPALFGFADDFQLVTALTCYANCSTANRGVRLQYPRLQSQLHRQIAEAEQVTLSFREGCYFVDVVGHLWSDESLSGDLSCLMLRSLLDSSVRLPSHPINAITALPPSERKLMERSVARHAAYGLSYRESARGAAAGSSSWSPRPAGGVGGGAWNGEPHERKSDWRLIPELDLLGGIRRPFSAPAEAGSGVYGNNRFRGSRFGSQHHGGGGGAGTRDAPRTTPGSAMTLATPTASAAPHNTASPLLNGASTLACRVLTLREETKQLLQGEIVRYTVQRTAAVMKMRNDRADAHRRSRATLEVGSGGALTDTSPSAAAKSARTEARPEPSSRAAAEQDMIDDLHGAIRQAAQGGEARAEAAGRGGAVLRDFFGRPIPPKAVSASPPAGLGGASGGGGGAAASSGGKTQGAKSQEAASSAVPALVPVRYVYHDGCTNAVKMPATFADF